MCEGPQATHAGYLVSIRPSSRRLVWNPKALILTGAVLAGVVGLCIWLKMTQSDRLRATALTQAERALKDGRPDKALRHLDHFLGTSPDDVPALELKARILAEAARGTDELREAARWNDRLLRIDPGGADRQSTRRRLAELYIRYSVCVRLFTLLTCGGGLTRMRRRSAARRPQDARTDVRPIPNRRAISE